MIASHYAEPLARTIRHSTFLRAEPSENAPLVREVERGERFAMLDDSLGWAWGYCGEEGRVGYILSAALAESPENASETI